MGGATDGFVVGGTVEGACEGSVGVASVVTLRVVTGGAVEGAGPVGAIVRRRSMRLENFVSRRSARSLECAA